MLGEVERVLAQVRKPEPLAGNPFEEGISDAERAGRFQDEVFDLVGRRHIVVENYDVVYRCDLFHRFIPRVGIDGRGLYQFWGMRAERRLYKDGAKGPWVHKGPRLQTVPVRELRVRKNRRGN